MRILRIILSLTRLRIDDTLPRSVCLPSSLCNPFLVGFQHSRAKSANTGDEAI